MAREQPHVSLLRGRKTQQDLKSKLVASVKQDPAEVTRKESTYT